MISLDNLQVMFSLFVICVICVKKIYCVFYDLFCKKKYQNECKICLTNQHIKYPNISVLTKETKVKTLKNIFERGLVVISN